MGRRVLAKYLYTCDGITRNGHFCQQFAVIEATSPGDADEIVKRSWRWHEVMGVGVSNRGDRGWICGEGHRKASGKAGNSVEDDHPDGGENNHECPEDSPHVNAP